MSKKTFINGKWLAFATLTGFFPPFFALAQGGILTALDGFISFLLIIVPILLGLAVLVFFWGIVKFISHADDPKANEEGKQLIIWGLVTLFVMVAFWAILGWLQGEFGLNNGSYLGNLPQQPDTIPTP